MKVLFLATWYPYPLDSGSKIRVYHLLRALSARHEVTLVSFAFGTSNPHGLQKHDRICSDQKIVWRDPFERSPIARATRFFLPGSMVGRPVPEMVKAVEEVLAEHDFDLAIASTWVMAEYVRLTPPSTAKILEEHNLMSRWMWERYRDQTEAIQRFRCWVSWQKTLRYENQLFRRFHLVTMVSEQDRANMLSMLPGFSGPVEVFPNGVDCQDNRPGMASPLPNTLVYSGALNYRANYDAMYYFLAEIYPHIKAAVPTAKLIITGSIEGVNLSGLALDPSVHLTGFVEDVRQPVAKACVCVVPIRQGGGTRLKILEAMALGIPVVATSKGAEGIDVVDGEHLLLADDPVSFAKHTVRLLQDVELRQSLTDNARRLVERRYDWQSIGQQFVAAVENTIETTGWTVP